MKKHLNNYSMQNIKSNLIKVTAAAALLLAFHTPETFEAAVEETGLETIYHIYNNGDYIGAVSDEEKVENLIDEKIVETNQDFEALDLQASDEFNMIAERVFEPVAEDEAAVMNQLEEELAIMASTFVLSIDGEAAVHLKDREAYDKVLRLVKQTAVTEDQLKELEVSQRSAEALPELEEGEARITEVDIEGEIAGTTQQTSPEKVMTAEEAADYLLNDMGIKVSVEKEEKAAEGIAYETATKKDEKLYKGKTKTEQEGKEGKKEVTYRVKVQDGKEVERSEIAQKVLEEPTEEIILEGAKEIPEVGTGEFAWPAEGGYISSQKGPRWGRQHQGIDIAQPDGFDIKAADHGVVKAAGPHETFGNRVVIDHKNGYETIYAHLKSIDVKVGQKVPQGTKLGVMGTTGRSTGVHLHFEISKDGANKDPLHYVKE